MALAAAAEPRAVARPPRPPRPSRAGRGRLSPPVAAPWDLHAVAHPAGLFSGDFYLALPSRDTLWVALGDVAGKGLEAALVSSLAQETMEPLLLEGAPPAAVVAAVHRVLARELRSPRRFLTLLVGRLDAAGFLELTNAGHFPALVVRRGGGVEEIGSHGTVVGVFPDSAWGSSTVALGTGDTLVLYSDGLLEARSPAGDELGATALRRHAAAVAGAAPAAVAEHFLGAAERHRNGLAPEDDTTLVVVRRAAATASPAA